MMSEAVARRFEPIVFGEESTVVAEYTPDSKTAAGYQTEAELEDRLIALLKEQKYEYLPITSDNDLTANLRKQLENLNSFTFSDNEWQTFLSESIAGSADGIKEKSVRIQEDHIQILEKDDGTSKNVVLIDKQNIHNNHLQVINQYESTQANGARYNNRYDVTILVNGFPMVHIELKRRGVDLREAFNQIDRYQRDSFTAGSGLFGYVQLFIISNGTLTKYYSNTTRQGHLQEIRKVSKGTKSSHSFEFTSWWADAKNRPIQELESFTKTFFAKHTLLSILTRYCVLTVDKQLLVMRPYQIVATEKILQKVNTSVNTKTLGTIAAGGYIWHTTGSGKTLTSFKTAQLVSGHKNVDKVLFIVDRKDLDYQTMREYDRFEKGAASSNASSHILKKQLENPQNKIIITTIQKLSTFVKNNKNHPIFSKHVVMIFDECHRSQFGSMHTLIKKSFKKYNLFGFTGTPIFKANASNMPGATSTTEEVFGDKLHTYTIVDAITDRNVLPFHIEYHNVSSHLKDTDENSSEEAPGQLNEKALLAPARINKITSHILEHYDQKTKRSSGDSTDKKQAKGFNALLATASIEAAMLYYQEFKKQQKPLDPAKRLKVGIIYSYGANEPMEDGLLADESFEPDALPGDARTFLEEAIKDYNATFGTSFDTSADKFQNYYKDLSRKLKERNIDLVIVVNMFLTGFDATTLNTLYVDKSLRAHGLIQAYSRTNRILNSVKTQGNIVNYRDLEEATDEAIALFGNKDARAIILLKPFKEYYEQYSEKATDLLTKFSSSMPIIGETAQREYVKLFGEILRLRNILTAFDDFEGDTTLTDREVQDHSSRYLDLHANFKKGTDETSAYHSEDLVFEIELVKQVEINVDYILAAVERNRGALAEGDAESKAEIIRAVNASPTLRSKSDLIAEFVDTLKPEGSIGKEWQTFIKERQTAELEALIKEENLKAEEAHNYIKAAFKSGNLSTTGTAITKVLPPTSRFTQDSNRSASKERVLNKFQTFFDRFFGTTSN